MSGAGDNETATVRRSALLALSPAAGALVIAATATVSRESATLFGVEGPPCPLGSLLGECACPGCGLTRSTSMVVQGRFDEALALNPGGFVVAVLAAAAVLLHLDVMRRGQMLPAHRKLRWFGHRLFAVGVLFAWAARAFGWFAATT